MYKYIKTLLVRFLIFLLGTRTTYAKTELVLPQNQVSFSIEQTQVFKSQEKVLQPNLGFLKDKCKFEISECVSVQNQHKFSGREWCELANGGDDAYDALLDGAKAFDDNVIDIAEVGLQNWKTFQNRIYTQLKTLYPNNKIGSQITLDVTYIENRVTKVKTLITDDLIQIEVYGIEKYKIIDAKTSTCTKKTKRCIPFS